MLTQNILHSRKYPLGKTVKQLGETGIELFIKQVLRLLIISDMDKLVAMGLKIYSLTFQLAAQPLATVQADLDMIGEPGLQTYVHESDFAVIKIKIQMLTLSLIILQLRESGLCAIHCTKR